MAGTRTVESLTVLLAEARRINISKRQWIQAGATTTTSDGIRDLGTHHSNGEDTLQQEAYIRRSIDKLLGYEYRGRGRYDGAIVFTHVAGRMEAPTCGAGLRRELWQAQHDMTMPTAGSRS